MLERILYNIKAYLGDEADGKDTLLAIIVGKVIANVKLYRNYPSNYEEESINSDLEKYENKIFEIALAEYNRIGVEGESNHSENGVGASFVSNAKLYDGILPIARVG